MIAAVDTAAPPQSPPRPRHALGTIELIDLLLRDRRAMLARLRDSSDVTIGIGRWYEAEFERTHPRAAFPSATSLTRRDKRRA